MDIFAKVRASSCPWQGLVTVSCLTLCLGNVELHGDLTRALLRDHIGLVGAVVDIMVAIDHVRVIDGVGAPRAITGDTSGHGAYRGDG